MESSVNVFRLVVQSYKHSQGDSVLQLLLQIIGLTFKISQAKSKIHVYLGKITAVLYEHHDSTTNTALQMTRVVNYGGRQ